MPPCQPASGCQRHLAFDIGLSSGACEPFPIHSRAEVNKWNCLVARIVRVEPSVNGARQLLVRLLFLRGIPIHEVERFHRSTRCPGSHIDNNCGESRTKEGFVQSEKGRGPVEAACGRVPVRVSAACPHCNQLS